MTRTTPKTSCNDPCPQDLNLERHNERQRRYFTGDPRPRMVPRDTPCNRRQAEELMRFSQLRPGERVLEVGCGMGRHIFYMAGKGLHMEGVELTPGLIKHLRAYDGGRFNLPVYCADILSDLPGLERRYDAVIGFFTLHHHYDLKRSFKAMARFLKPGGRVAFVEPNPFNLLYYIQITLTPRMSWKGDKGIFQMRRPIVFGAMEAAGFDNFALSRFGFFPPFLSNRPWGARLEAVLERGAPWQGMLPFQIFGGRLK